MFAVASCLHLADKDCSMGVVLYFQRFNVLLPALCGLESVAMIDSEFLFICISDLLDLWSRAE